MINFGLALQRHEDLPRRLTRGILPPAPLYVGFFFPHVALLREQPDGWRWVLFTLYTAMGSDSGAYFAGRAWGRRKLMPGVSPSKTVEGAFGGLAGAVVIALICRATFFQLLGERETVGVALAIAVLAELGDLCESALKRAFGAKDSGWIIPGHGGILDRPHSLLFPFVFAFYHAVTSELVGKASDGHPHTRSSRSSRFSSHSGSSSSSTSWDTSRSRSGSG